MHRKQIIALLEKYQPIDAEENSHKTNILTFVKSNSDCFERSNLQGHITSSCWLVSKDFSRALLTHHRKLDAWLQLGGHCDGDHDVLSSALKEAKEESGIEAIEAVNESIFDVDVHKIPANSRDPEHCHYDIRFLLRITSDQKPIISNESKDLKFISTDINSLPNKDKTMVRMFNKWLEHIEHLSSSNIS